MLFRSERTAAHIHSLTGGLPQHVQFCGKRLAKLALQQPDGQISSRMAEDLRNDEVTRQYLSGPLKELDTTVRGVAIHLLQQEQRLFPATTIQAACEASGVKGVTPERATEIGDTLVILNFLAWEKGQYRVANQVLCDHVLERRSVG